MSQAALLAITLLLTSLSASAYADEEPKFINRPSCEEKSQRPHDYIYAHCYEPLVFDTGELFNDGDSSKVVYEWEKPTGDVQLLFSGGISVQLSSDSVIPEGAMIRMTDIETGKYILESRLKLTELVRPSSKPRPASRNDLLEQFRDYSPWDYSEIQEAYILNFDRYASFRIEFIAPPRSSMRLIFEKLYLPGPPSFYPFLNSHDRFIHREREISIPNKNTCGQKDNREPSFNPAVARLLKGQDATCTGFIADCPAGPDKCFVSAGHCLKIFLSDGAEFNVPESNPDTCTTNHPSVESIFSIDPTTAIAVNDMDGDGDRRDWAVMRLAPNRKTHKTSFEQQGASLTLRSNSLPTLGSPLRLTGYGVDTNEIFTDSVTACLPRCIPGDGRRNRTQQSNAGVDAGALLDFSEKIIVHDVDSCVGSSGSPVDFAGQVIGITTTGACTASGDGVNSGTNIQHPDLSRALGNPFDIKDSNVVVDLDAAMNATGDGVIVWENTFNNRVRFRTLSPGMIMGPETQFVTSSASVPDPKVDIASNGTFAVVYRTLLEGLSGQVHNPNGSVAKPSFPLGVSAIPLSHDVVTSPSGDFSAIWMVDRGNTGTFLQIRRFPLLGLPLTEAMDVAEIDNPVHTATSIQRNNSGRSLVLWQESNSNIQARVYNSAALPESLVFSLPATSAVLLNDHTIIAASNENFQIVGRKYSQSGALISGPVVLAASDGVPNLVSMHSYGFFLTWGDGPINARQFFLDASPIADAFTIGAGKLGVATRSHDPGYVLAARNAGLFLVSDAGVAQFILKSSDAAVIETINIFANGFESGDTSRWTS